MGRRLICSRAVCAEPYFLSQSKAMLYQIFLENGPVTWLAFQTRKKEEANTFLESAKAPFVYLRILDDNDTLVSIRCQKFQIKGL
jgi:hypothetical protein